MADSKKIIVLTGVSRGLGLAMAEGFIERGHTIIGALRDKQAIARLSKRWPAPHRFTAVDVSHDQQVKAWAEEAGRRRPARFARQQCRAECTRPPRYGRCRPTSFRG